MPWSVGQIKSRAYPRLVEVGVYRDLTYSRNPLNIYLDYPYLHVAAYGDSRYTILDVTDPTAISLVGSVKDTTNLPEPNGVVTVGNYAYILSYAGSRLTPIDISTLSSPTVTGTSIVLPGAGGDLAALSSSYLLAGTTSTARNIDISTPTTPVDVGSTVTNNSYQIFNDPFNTNYLASRSSGAVPCIIDRSTPSAPTVLTSFATNSTFVDTSNFYTNPSTTFDVYDYTPTLLYNKNFKPGSFYASGYGYIAAADLANEVIIMNYGFGGSSIQFNPGRFYGLTDEIIWGPTTYPTFTSGSSFTNGVHYDYLYPYLYVSWRYNSSIHVLEFVP